MTYSNAAKADLVGVSAGTLERFGAVSEETAREMALGARVRFGASIGLSVTGIAGPGGGTPGEAGRDGPLCRSTTPAGRAFTTGS